MTFSTIQVRKLRSKLRPQHIKTREAEGISLSYLEGWHVVAEANRIFGFDGWDRETVSSECVWTKQNNGRYCAAYVTRIRVRVRAGEAVVLREGSGAGEANAATPGQAHEFAAKAAETDATKRALMTFGNAFGLSLYGGTTEPKGKPPTSSLKSEGGDVDQIEGIHGTQAAEPVTTTSPTLREDDHITDEVTRNSVRTSISVTLPGPAWPEFRPLDEAERMDQERQERVDKSALVISEPLRRRDLAHLAYVASKPCLVCGRNRAHAHHLKFAQPTALGRKVSDEFTVPLCSLHHRELHRHGDERVWWAERGLDALAIAGELWRSHGSRASPSPIKSED